MHMHAGFFESGDLKTMIAGLLKLEIVDARFLIVDGKRTLYYVRPKIPCLEGLKRNSVII